MTLKVYRPLNVATEEYEQVNEGISRRTIEQNF